MVSQITIRQCWSNAYESEEDYEVPVGSMEQAVALRAQCHKWRRRQAEGLDATRPERHPFYELEIRIKQNEGKFWVVFSRKGASLALPPIVRTKVEEPAVPETKQRIFPTE